MADPRIQAYAEAIFGIAHAEGSLETVEDELFRFARIVEGDNALRDGLTNPGVAPAHRAELIGDLLGGKASPHTVNAVRFIVEQGRARDLGAIAGALVERAAAERARAVAEVRAAVPLGGAEREQLRAAIERATGKAVDVKVVIDPSIIGGILVRVGDVVFDGTVRGRLEQVKERLERG